MAWLLRHCAVLVLILPALAALGSRPAAAMTPSWRQLISPGCTSNCPSSPPPRGDAMMALDPATHTTVFFGGLTSRAEFLNDTWSFNGSTWAQVISPGCSTACPYSPPARFGAAMTHDAATNTIILFGGFGAGSTGGCCFALNDTWSFDGSTWTQLAGPTGPAGCGGALPCSNSPSGRLLTGVAYDDAAQRIVLFGGCATPSFAGCGSSFNDTWSFDGSLWRQIVAPGCTAACPNSPPARFAMGMAYDGAAHAVVLFGGGSPVGLVNDTWSFNGAAWTQLIFPGCTNACPNSPPARLGMGMAFDETAGAVVLFGGTLPAGLANDTWGFSGAAWVQTIAPGCISACPGSPPARSLTNLVYDAATRALILLGGNASGSGVNYLNDTWSLPCAGANAGLAVATQCGNLPSVGHPTGRAAPLVTTNPSPLVAPSSPVPALGLQSTVTVNCTNPVPPAPPPGGRAVTDCTLLLTAAPGTAFPAGAYVAEAIITSPGATFSGVSGGAGGIGLTSDGSSSFCVNGPAAAAGGFTLICRLPQIVIAADSFPNRVCQTVALGAPGFDRSLPVSVCGF
jgi:hypothetical protein